ncbi:enoyl-CoA hydratase/isomerase family protein [Jeotgalibacillus soli]|uniref:Enoyl-CoA hydratase n=1 Tax=Jeotgalibacillus soli TaxID=889306 RepID=A0A0C2VL98_9BACL|nr:enoyl-CoA hydratase/isomerase family protein [Jeotgalibacillus soli]KIL44778.1 hypothetical protein KP78_23220 [Jeotgalibacillus soli]
MAYRIERLDSVLLFCIDRPERRNAINIEVMDGLQKAIDNAREDHRIKVLMITGEGNQAFCSGGDLQVFHKLKTQQEAYSMLSKMGGILHDLATLPKMTVAFINGTAIGGGCEIAAACDFRISRPKAKLGFVQGDLSITTGWGGGTLLYERLLPNQALTILTTATVREAESFHDLGFIDYMCEGETYSEAIELLQPIILKNVHVLMAYKQMLIEKWKKSDLQHRMQLEIQECSMLWEKQDHHDAVDAFLQGNPRKNTKS